MDQLYIEEGYIDASYYGIVAEAGANLTGAFTPSFTVDIADATGYYIPDYIDANYFEAAVTGTVKEFDAALELATTVVASVGVVYNATATISAVFSQTTIGSRDRDIDMFAFSNAALTAQVSLLLDYQLSVNSIFNVATDFVRYRTGSATADSNFAVISEANRSRDFNLQIEAAVSLEAQANVVNVASAALNTQSSLTVATNNTVLTNADLTAQFTVDCDAELIKEPMLLGAWMNTSNVYQGIRIVQDRLNNIYALGRAANNISDFHNVLIVKTDATGEIIWQNTYSQLYKYADYAELLTEGDNLYLVAGTWGSTNGSTDDDTQVFKISSVTGEILQQTRFNDLGCRSATLYNGNLYLYGGTVDNTYEINVLSISTADLTQINWQKAIDEIGTDTLNLFTMAAGNVAVNANGVYVIVRANAAAGGTGYALLFKLNVATGSLLLTQRSAANVVPYDIEVDSQGNVIASMRYATAERIVKFDKDLTVIWARDVGSTGTESRISIDGTDNIAVLRTSLGKVVVIDTDGDLVSRTSIEGNYSDIFAKDEWLLTVGDGYWTGAVQGSYDYVKNIWIAQTLSSGEGAPVTALENYAGADGVWTYANTADDISTASATFSLDTDWFIVNSDISTGTLASEVTATAYPWKILGRIVSGGANIQSTISLTADVLRIRGTSVTLNATVQQSTTAVKTTTTSSVFETTVATQTTTAVKTARVIANAQTTSTVNIETANSRIRFYDAAMQTDSVLSASFGLIKTPGAVSMAAEFNQTAVNGRLRDNQSTFESIAIEIAVVVKVGDFLINLESSFEQATGAVKTTNTSAAIDAVVTSSATATKTTDIVKTLSSETTLTAASDKIKAVGAEFAVAFTQDTAAAKITVTSINASSAFTTVIPAKRIRFGTAGLNTATSIVCEALLIVNAAAELNSAVTGIFVFDKIVRIQANLEVQGFVLSAGRVIHIDEYYTIIVPQEYRRIKTLAESRTIQVDEETRVELI